MIRGTTPELNFTVPFDPTVAEKIWITFSQNDEEVFTIEKNDCTFGENLITCSLSQNQTLSLSPNSTLQIQMRVSFADGKEDAAMASNIVTTTVQRILKDGVI